MREEYPYAQYPCVSVGQRQMEAMRQEVAKLREQDVSDANEAATIDALYKKYDIPPASIDKAAITVEEVPKTVRIGEVQGFLLDVSPSTPTQINTIEFRIPITGDPKFFTMRPSNSNVLHNVQVRDSHIAFFYAPSGESPEQLRSRFDADLKRFEENLDRLCVECAEFNARLRPQIKPLVDERRRLFASKSQFLDGLGFPRQ